MSIILATATLPRASSPYTKRRSILIAAEGSDMTGLARQLFTEGYRVNLRTDPQAVLAYLADGRRPSVIIIDPTSMAPALSAIAGLRSRPSIIAVTGERRPQRLINALNTGLYSAWLSRPCVISEAYPVIIERLDHQETQDITDELTTTIMLATRDMLHAARNDGPLAHIVVKSAMDTAAAAEDYRALQSRDLFYCPSRLGVWALLGPMRERWTPLVKNAGIAFKWDDFPQAKLYCDTPLCQQAVRVMLGQAVRYASADGELILSAVSDTATGGLTLKCKAIRRTERPAASYKTYQAFSEAFVSHIAKMHGGVFDITTRRREIIQSLYLPDQPPM